MSKITILILALFPPVLHFSFMRFFVNASAGGTVEDNITAWVYAGLLSIGVFTFMYHSRKPPFAPERKVCRFDLIWVIAISAIAANIAFAASIGMIQKLLGTNLPTSSLQTLLNNVELSESALRLLTINVVLIAPIAEELCFRGLMFNRLLAAFPFWTANVIQAAVFGLIHFSLIQSIYAFLFGLMLGWIYHRTGRFSAVVAAHIAFNSPLLLL
jgi:membrane protease YdiL (CAAX protease family)